MPDHITVRQAVGEDADGIAGVQVESWRAAYRGTVPDAFLDGIDRAERAERSLEGVAGQPEGRASLVAEWDGEIAGFAAFGPCRDADACASVAELYAIYVLSDRWRRGIGRALHDACLAELRRAGFEEAWLWVLEENPVARAFYEGLDWRPDGTKVPHAFGDTELPIVRYRQAL